MRKKKTLKGMTLVEILIAIAILGVMSLFIARNASVIEKYNMSTTRLNKKVALEGPLAETGIVENEEAAKIDDSVTIHVGYVDSGGADKEVQIKGKAYSVEEAYDDDGMEVGGSGLNLKFLKLDPIEKEEEEG